MIMITIKKFTSTIIEACRPNALIGTIGDMILEAKATEVVLEVTAMAFAALLKLYAIRL